MIFTKQALGINDQLPTDYTSHHEPSCDMFLWLIIMQMNDHTCGQILHKSLSCWIPSFYLKTELYQNISFGYLNFTVKRRCEILWQLFWTKQTGPSYRWQGIKFLSLINSTTQIPFKLRNVILRHKFSRPSSHFFRRAVLDVCLAHVTWWVKT